MAWVIFWVCRTLPMRRRISLVLAMASPPTCAPELLQRGPCKVRDLLTYLVGQRRALLQLLHELGTSGGELAQNKVTQRADLRNRHLLIDAESPTFTAGR